MKMIEKMRIRGMVARRPSASATPIGIEVTMPVTETTSVTRRPPHSLVSTTARPPRSRPITAMMRATPTKLARHVRSIRHPVRTPPESRNNRPETMIAVSTKSIQTG